MQIIFTTSDYSYSYVQPNLRDKLSVEVCLLVKLSYIMFCLVLKTVKINLLKSLESYLSIKMFEYFFKLILN